ncbi:signal peptide peptidase SppA, 36K type [hydrothermal vent metagenome]|uniref:Signal peptide peptidase SppA, 36K type n=1 Tax=hydrothermal vent metagenome TaxID=652676 RepID=A0A3B0V6W4_9ZZZZ
MKSALKTILAVIGAFVVLIIVILIVIVFVGRSANFDFGDKIAVIDIKGIILDPREINTALSNYAKRDDVKAVVLRIDSPGGAVGPSQEIYREVQRFRTRKKLVVSMGSVAASGGYYIAAAADKIVANPGTITGSIGVIVEFMNTQELFKKIGLKGTVIKSGTFKDTGSPLRELTETEKKLLGAVVNDIHSQFVEAVAQGRNMKPEDVAILADGRIFSGAQAMRLGLVDQLGSLEDAIDEVAKLAGIEGKHSVIYPQKRRGLLKELMGVDAGSYLQGMVKGTRVMYMTEF